MQQDRPTDRDETAGPDRDPDREDTTDTGGEGSGKQWARGVPPEPDRDEDDTDADPKGSGKQFARGVPPDPGPPERP